jgi:hypothetical protein
MATGTAIALGVGAAGSIGGAALGAHGAQSAADTQAQSAKYAADLQNQQFQQQQQNLQPWLKAGTGALSQLSAGLQPGGQFAQSTYPQFQPYGAAQTALNPSTFQPTGMAQQALNPSAFQAPTAEQAAAMPGYQFAYDQGLQALQRSQAATGITGGGAAKAAEQYGQGLASTNYQQAYNNALQAYGTNQAAAQQALGGQSGVYGQNLGAAQNALSGQSGVYGTNYDVTRGTLSDAYNRLAGLAGVGQNATSQANQAGQNYATNVGNLLTSSGAAQAAGQMGAANAWAGGLGGLGNTAMNLYALNSIYGQPNSGFDAGQSAGNAAIYGNVADSVLAGLPQAPIARAPFVSSTLPGLQQAYTTQYGAGLNQLLQPGSSYKG